LSRMQFDSPQPEAYQVSVQEGLQFRQGHERAKSSSIFIDTLRFHIEQALSASAQAASMCCSACRDATTHTPLAL
jgi:hypothetical protein